ncbi:DNA-binding protein [Bosea thiooxidans]
MPTRQQVWTAADHIRGKSERVSLRSVRAELPRGGSYRDIGEHLASWKAERNYQPKIELAQLPEFVNRRGVSAPIGVTRY